jgi:hypothetical protein
MTVASETQFEGKEAIKVLSNGIIINERSIKEMSGPFANYHKQFSVAYKSQIYACEVEQNDLKVKSFCIRTQFD